MFRGTGRVEWGDMYDSGNDPLQAPPDLVGAVGAATGDGGEVDHDEILEALDATIDQFGRLIAGRSAEELRQAAQDGRWGITEILSHLQDWEEIFHHRVERMLEEREPALEDHDDTLWAIEHDYGSRDGHEVFEQFSTLRRDLVERLRDLEADAWQRTARLPEREPFTLGWLMQWLVDHDLRHLEQARDACG